jgi:hypothetical protein
MRWALSAAALLAGASGAALSADARTMLTPVKRALLCITEGSVAEAPRQRLSVTAAKMRAVLPSAGRQAIEARFTYLGATAETAPLRSGEVRRQFGLKLRAADGCNLVYAMWRFDPEPGLIVSVKSNPGLHESKACGNRGYHTIRPRHAGPVAAPVVGEQHRLTAEMSGATLQVLIDGSPVWEGDLGAEAMAADGPVGMRSDNVRLEVELLAGLDGGTAGSRAAGCPARDPGRED